MLKGYTVEKKLTFYFHTPLIKSQSVTVSP